MAEYIVGTDEHEGHWYTGERIVRCRDCKYANELMGEPDMLDCQGRLTTTWDYYNDIPLPNAVESDGFCKWGERRDDA